jgi:hypothetical protein
MTSHTVVGTYDDVATHMWELDDVTTQMWELDDASTQMWELDDVKTQMWELDDVTTQMWELDDVTTQMWEDFHWSLTYGEKTAVQIENFAFQGAALPFHPLYVPSNLSQFPQ